MRHFYKFAQPLKSFSLSYIDVEVIFLKRELHCKMSIIVSIYISFIRGISTRNNYWWNDNHTANRDSMTISHSSLGRVVAESQNFLETWRKPLRRPRASLFTIHALPVMKIISRPESEHHTTIKHQPWRPNVSSPVAMILINENKPYHNLLVCRKCVRKP